MQLRRIWGTGHRPCGSGGGETPSKTMSHDDGKRRSVSFYGVIGLKLGNRSTGQPCHS